MVMMEQIMKRINSFCQLKNFNFMFVHYFIIHYLILSMHYHLYLVSIIINQSYPHLNNPYFHFCYSFLVIFVALMKLKSYFLYLLIHSKYQPNYLIMFNYLLTYLKNLQSHIYELHLILFNINFNHHFIFLKENYHATKNI